MTTTTIDQQPPVTVRQPTVKLLIGLAIAVLVLTAAFAAGRATASSRTTRPGVTASVPAQQFPDACHVGRPC